MHERLCGIDVGTTACKVAIVSPDGRELAHGRAPTPWRRVPSGAEIDPQAFVAGALAAVREALAAAPGTRVVAVGVASLAETGVLLDGAGQPVVPSLAWHDARGAEQADELSRLVDPAAFAARTGLRLGPVPSLPKLRHLLAHDPGARRGVRWLGVAEWVAHRLGAAPVADLSLASRSGFLDLGARRWWDEALAFAGAPAGLLPELEQPGTAIGRVADDHPVRELRGAVLATAGLDHSAGAVGAGATADDAVFDSCGTAEALLRATAPLPPAEVAAAVARGLEVNWHVVPGRQVVIGAQLLGLELQRTLDLLGSERWELESDQHPRAEEWRAAVGRVADGATALLAELEETTGPYARLALAGGWTHSPTLVAAKQARLSGIELELPGVVEAGARGAALLAGVAAGVYDDPRALPAPPPD